MAAKFLYSMTAFSRFSDDKMESAITPEEVTFTQKALKYMLRLIHQIPCEAKTPNQQAFLHTAKNWMREYQETLKASKAFFYTPSTHTTHLPSNRGKRPQNIAQKTSECLTNRTADLQDTMLALNGGRVHTQNNGMSILWLSHGLARNRSYDE